jgi:hypothetical protein
MNLTKLVDYGFVRAFVTREAPVPGDKYSLLRAQKKAILRELRALVAITGDPKEKVVVEAVKNLRYLSKIIRREQEAEDARRENGSHENASREDDR